MHLRNSADLRRWSPFAEMDERRSVLSPQTNPQVKAHFAEMRSCGDGSAPPTNTNAPAPHHARTKVVDQPVGDRPAETAHVDPAHGITPGVTGSCFSVVL